MATFKSCNLDLLENHRNVRKKSSRVYRVVNRTKFLFYNKITCILKSHLVRRQGLYNTLLCLKIYVTKYESMLSIFDDFEI